MQTQCEQILPKLKPVGPGLDVRTHPDAALGTPDVGVVVHVRQRRGAEHSGPVAGVLEHHGGDLVAARLVDVADGAHLGGHVGAKHLQGDLQDVHAEVQDGAAALRLVPAHSAAVSTRYLRATKA